MTTPAAERRRRMGLLSGTGLAVALGLLTFVNLLADRFFVRFDWTNHRRYSLSPATKSLLRSLEDPVILRLYLSPGLPQPYASQGRYIQELLHEYRTAGHGKVTLDIKSPDESDAWVMETRRLNIQPGRFTQVASDQFQVREGYMGLALFYQDKQDVIPFIKETDNLEYEISSRVRLMTQKSKKTLFFVSNHQEVSPDFIRQGPAGRLFDEFRVETPSLSTATVGRRPDGLFLLGPQRSLSPEELDALDQALVDGIPVAVALNRRVIMPQNFRSMAQVTGLEPWLEHYGVNVSREFLMDEQCQNIAMRSAETTFYVKYWPFVLSNDLNREHLATRDLDVLGFPYANPLSFNFSGASTLKGTVLARSSAKSWVWPGLYNVDPPSLFAQLKSESPATFDKSGKRDQLGPFPLAVVVEGATTTYRTPSRPIPNLRLVVLGTSFFANPQVPNPEGNALSILALAHWMTQESNYLAIPPKDSPFRPLRPVSNGLRRTAKAAGYFLIPALIVLAGFLHWRRRQILRARVQRAHARTEAPRA